MRSRISKTKRNFNHPDHPQRQKDGSWIPTTPYWILLAAGVFWGLRVSAGAFEINDNRDVSAKKPVNISSFQLIYDRLKGLTLFKGKVKAVHGNVTLTADEIRAVSENREATAEGKVKVVDSTAAMTLTCGNLEYQDKMNLMTAHDQPLLTSLDENGRPITVQGRQMELDSEKKTVVIHQNVRITHGDGRAEAQKATFLAKEDKFILEEDPKLFVPNGELSGRRIVSNLGSSRSVVVEGMADAVFYPAGSPTTGQDDHRPTSPKDGAHGTTPTSPVSLTGKDQGTAVSQPQVTPTPAPSIAPSGFGSWH